MYPSSQQKTIASAPTVEVLEEMALAMAQSTICGAMQASQTSRAVLAERMSRPRSFVTRMLGGAHNLTIKTMAKALAGCGYELRFSFAPIESTSTKLVQEPEPEVKTQTCEANNSNFALAA
jgi:hypothetical protein